MLSYAGVETNVVVTRGYDNGGFDGSFISPEQLEIPLLLVKLNSQNVAAFPFSKACRLGEYPLSLHGLSALKLSQSSIIKIPPSTAANSVFSMKSSVDISNLETPSAITIELEGYWAFIFRSMFQQTSKAEQNEILQKVLTNNDKSNALIDAEISGIETPGGKLSVSLTMKNRDCLIEKKGEHLLSLTAFFESMFTEIVENRTVPIETSHTYTKNEEIRFIGGAQKVKSTQLPMASISNKLFSSKVSSEKSNDDFVVKRTTMINAAAVPAVEIPAIYQDVQRLNEITKKSILF